MIAETNLIKFLVSNPAISAIVGDRVQQSTVQQDEEMPYIWFERSGIEHERCINDQPGQEPFATLIDLECVAETVADAQALGDTVRAELDAMLDPFGDIRASVFVEDVEDDYLPRNQWEDSGTSVVAFDVAIQPRV